MSKHLVSCWSCGSQWEFIHPMGRSEACNKCGWDAKVCYNCRFYDKSSYRECLEEQAELVKDKDKRNFCSWFEAKADSGQPKQVSTGNPLDALFGGSGATKPKSKLEEELESFFKK